MSTVHSEPQPATPARRALVVDDHELIRDAATAWLVEGGAVAAADAVATRREMHEMLASGTEYSIILVDLSLPDANGLEALTSLRETWPYVPVLVLSATTDMRTIHGALEAGAQGYCPKSCAKDGLLAAVRDVLDGKMSVPPEALLGFATLTKAPSLTSREMQVLRLLLKAMPSKVIARDLGIAEGTVKAHLNSIYRQFHVNSRAGAILAAINLGMN